MPMIGTARAWAGVLALWCFAGSALAQQAPSGEEAAREAPEASPGPQATQPVALPDAAEPVQAAAGREVRCDDREDDDGDGMVDCADADCFEERICEAGGAPERNDERCSDWVDNDGDGAVDCDDSDCQGPGITVCRGSWRGQSGAQLAAGGVAEDDLPELTGDMTVEDLIGNFGDADGERNDYLCADGIDNDGDGRADCADFGCRFDPQVSVCQSSPGVRFSVVAGVAGVYEPTANDSETEWDVRFTRIQLRVLGRIPLIEDSFFLLSSRWDKSPRLTFAHFQVPIGDSRWYAALNSGSGSLTSGLIISAAKHPLLDPPFYLYNAFEQGSGAAAEIGGPLDADGGVRMRAFVAGGVGAFTGNIGGRFLPDRGENFAWGAGAQVAFNFIGYFDRFDSPYLYTPVPLTLGMAIGAKYDARPRERYPWANAQLIFRYSHLLLRAEANSKYVLDYGGAFQTAWNVQTSILLVPRVFMFAADVGQFYAQDFDESVDFGGSLRRPLDELQFRAAVHWYWYRNIGLLALVYRQALREQDPVRPEDPANPDDDVVEREVRLEAQFRF